MAQPRRILTITPEPGTRLTCRTTPAGGLEVFTSTPPPVEPGVSRLRAERAERAARFVLDELRRWESHSVTTIGAREAWSIHSRMWPLVVGWLVSRGLARVERDARGRVARLRLTTAGLAGDPDAQKCDGVTPSSVTL